MLFGGNVAFRGGNARMPERHGKLFDRCVAFMGQPGKTSPQVVRPYLGVHLSGMRKNNVVDGLSGKAYSGNCATLCDLSKQPPRYDGTHSAPLIHRRLGPDGNRYGSNAAVLANQIGDDPPVLYHTELFYRNRRRFVTSNATAEKDCEDGAVPLAPD